MILLTQWAGEHRLEGKSNVITGDINSLPHNPDLLMTLRNRPVGDIVGKGENAGNQHFLLFPQCFLLD